MKNNNEITLKIKVSMEEFKKILKEKGYTESEHFILYDTFMLPENLKIEELSTRDIISKAIIIRKVEDIAKNEIRRDMVYKMKKFNNKGEILEQKSVRLKVQNCKEAEIFINTIGYKKIMGIIEEDYTYQKDGFELTTKEVKNGDNMIEVETQKNNEKLDAIDKIKNILREENFPLDFSDCFIKKAEVELNKILNR